MRNGRGQFLIIAVLIVAVVLITTLIISYSFGTTYRRMRAESARHMVANVAEDLKRVALEDLAMATQHYSETGDIDSSRLWAINNLTFWLDATLLVHSSKGLSLSIGVYEERVIHDNVLGDLRVPVARTPAEAYEGKSWVKMWWYSRRAISLIYIEAIIGSSTLGLGPVYSEGFYMLNVTASKPEDLGGDYYLIKLQAFKEDMSPALLAVENITVIYFHSTLMDWVEAPRERMELADYGGGSYDLTVYMPSAYKIRNPNGDVIVPILLEVADSRGVYVELFPSYNRIEAVIEKDSRIRTNLNYEIYVVETLRDGRLNFNLKWFEGERIPPLPPIPVKQYRVNVTRGGVNSPATLTPFQVEKWHKIGTKYEWPYLEFPSYRGRLEASHKIVFLLFFNRTNVRRQKVVYWWDYDADAIPIPWSVKFRWDETGYAELDNDAIRVRLVADQKLSYWVDYSIIIYYKKYHAEFGLLGYSYYYMSPREIWLPEWLPSGDPSNRMGWRALVGPVRALIIRSSTKTYSPPRHATRYKDLSHNDIIIIPYATNYIIYRSWIKWLRTFRFNRYLTPLTIISGSSSDQRCPCRLRYWAFQTSRGNVVRGSYPNRYWSGYHYYIGGVGYWFVQYRERVSRYPDVSFGAIWDNYLKDMFSNYRRRYRYDHTLWVWTSADYARRVIELDIWFEWYRTGRVYKGQSNWYWFALFAGDGGSRNVGYRSIAWHAPMFWYPPSVVEVWAL